MANTDVPSSATVRRVPTMTDSLFAICCRVGRYMPESFRLYVAPTELPLILGWRSYNYLAPTEQFQLRI